MEKRIRYPELTIIVVGCNNVGDDVQKTMDSITCQSFADYEVVHADDERSALDYVSDETREGNGVLFLRAGDLLATQITLEENIRILAEKDEVDVVFFPWGETRDGWPYTYDVYSMKGLKPDFNKISETIRRVTCGSLYGKLFRKRVFGNIDLSGYSRFTPDLMVALVCNAKVLHWSPNGLYLYHGSGHGYADDFRFAYCLLLELGMELGKKSTVYANCFFLVLHRMLSLMSEHNLDLSEENAWLEANVPDFSCVFHSMKRDYKRSLVTIRIFGYGYFKKKTIR